MTFHRALSTLIPPKVVSVKHLTAAPNAKRITNVVDFYKLLPKGPAAKTKDLSKLSPIGRYKARYFDGENASGKPIIHLVLAIVTLGYSMEYYFHLRHHKNGEGAEH
ncbi:F1F0 ATP synthase subunit f NDAI_0A04490 [Naumovozyma dairenensis CBS 421]|uniref:ATP synthase subunit f, mitochondrial n=1 Tax=Naumovozyma dairenensis (strain ATCC 10597 / BCRC 20456 / CBS 421 / NBRC 0211 / NRRL Y-12639) TaxID=1071378 RepID=G0W467_NAUDC|nr:hypothetical protein NDAI_0A04490 [Naumovozyma dairenensis CBS 421]CCD22605.1 hypothetical protein NDAI_0A04490 [Naumovozyma dairenensis CBS 421]